MAVSRSPAEPVELAGLGPESDFDPAEGFDVVQPALAPAAPQEVGPELPVLEHSD